MKTKLAIWLILLCLFRAMLAAQVRSRPAIENEPKKEQKKKPGPTKSESNASFASLLVTSDTDVEINVNGEKKYIVKSSGEVKRLALEAGDNYITVKNLNLSGESYTEKITVAQKGNIGYEIIGSEKFVSSHYSPEIGKTNSLYNSNLGAIVKSIEDNMAFVVGGSISIDNASVLLNDFYISKYEVTQAQWRAVMENNPSNFPGCEKCPVEQVNWNQIELYIKELNSLTGNTYRLPTEAEWEYAARGGSKSKRYIYAGSNSLAEIAWYESNSSAMTHPVGKTVPNELGLYDMTGNVWEWCSDFQIWDNRLNGTHSLGDGKMVCGGSWRSEPDFLLPSTRIFIGDPYLSYDYVGLRLVREIH